MTSLTADLNAEGVTLHAPHSALTLTQHGFILRRGNKIILTSGKSWGTGAALIDHKVGSRHGIFKYADGAILNVFAFEDSWEFTWKQPTRDSFDLRSGEHWYGQGELVNQLYPLERASMWEAPFLTWDNGPNGLGNIQTPAWITATGIAILVDTPRDSLIVGVNASAEAKMPVWDLSGQSPAHLRPPDAVPGASGDLTLADEQRGMGYRIFVAENAPQACHKLIMALGQPESLPPDQFIRLPIWTTWARYKVDINQERVIAFAREIRDQGYPGGTLEIDDKWQQHYGDTTLDPTRFPDPAAMVRELEAMGFAVTVWITPFLSEGSTNTEEAKERGFLVRNQEGAPYPVLWWQGISYLLDLTNPEAVVWWADKLKALQESVGLRGFKFDAGEANYLPADGVTYMNIYRNEFSDRWASFGAEFFPYCEVRVGWFSQRHPILFRHWDKFSVWGYDNGLASVITTALALSLTGYVFTLPDMVGGNAYGGVECDKEMLIRWTQASAAMLSIQFSIAPWDFDQETVSICRKYADLFVSLAEDRISAADEARQTCVPMLRPVWWAAPHVSDAYIIPDQYLLGNKYLVAPVVQAGVRTRDVFLPPGQWRDYWTGQTYLAAEMGSWLRDFPAPLDTLPLFVRE